MPEPRYTPEVLLLLACASDPGAPPVLDPIPYIDPMIATGGTGFRVGSATPAASVPYGLAKPGPDTSTSFEGQSFYHCSGYYSEDTHIIGFSHMHLHGVGIPDGGDLLVMPLPGFQPTDIHDDSHRVLFDKASEVATAGYYAVELANGIQVQLSATAHAAHHQYRWPDGLDRALLIDLERTLFGSSLGGEVEVDLDAGVVSGYKWHAGGFSGGFGGFPIYFYAVVDGGIEEAGTWSEGVVSPGVLAAEGVDLGAWLVVRENPATMRFGLSMTSVEAAKQNLLAELPARPIAETRRLAEVAWREKLAPINLEGGSDTERTIFYTAMYHALLMPTIYSDVDGTYRGFDKEIHQGDTPFHSDMSLWDTYRTAHSFYTLFYPADSRNIATSLIRMAQEGGAFPRWPVAGGDGGSMIGAPADIVLADTWLRGVQDFDIDAAWPLLVNQARALTPIPYNGRPDVAIYEQYGYLPADMFGTSVGWTQELSQADGALARLGEALGHDDDAAHFHERSLYYRNVYDEDVGFFHARYSDGSFGGDFEPYAWRNEYAEGNAWQYLWLAAHDPEGLAEVLGGEQAALARLDEMFAGTLAEGILYFPQTWYWHGNEPDIHAPFLYSLWGRPDDTIFWSRWIEDRTYAVDPEGLAGNDDGGTLSAWYIFSTLGFYPLAGTDRWVLGAPRFPGARLRLGDHDLHIVSQGEGAHLAEVRLDGVAVPIHEGLRHHQLVEASELRFVMEP